MVFTHQGTIKTNLDLSMTPRAERPQTRAIPIMAGTASGQNRRASVRGCRYFLAGGSGVLGTGLIGSPRRSCPGSGRERLP